ncbi:MAG: hypothetical protein R3B40_08570 [Polyangiales bacterium]
MDDALSRAKQTGKNVAKNSWTVFKAELRFVLASFFRPFGKTLLVVGGLLFAFLMVACVDGMRSEGTDPLMWVVLPFFALFYALTVAFPIATVGGALRAAWTLSGPWVLVPVFIIPLALVISFWLMSSPLEHAGVGVAEACMQVGSERHWLLEGMGHVGHAGPVALVILLPVLLIDLGAILFSGPVLAALAWLLFMFVIAALLGLIPSGIASFLAVTLGYVRRFRRRHGDKLARLHEPSASDPPTSP